MSDTSSGPRPQDTRAGRKAQVREQVLHGAAHAIREHGIDGAGVAAIMQSAGLTHGTFYSHFTSKDDLVAQAIDHAAETFLRDLTNRAQTSGLTEAYLDPSAVADVGAGCTIAALGAEAARAGGIVAQAMADHVERSIATTQLATGDRQTAIRAFAGALGGLVLARAVPEGPRRDEILTACRDTTGTEGRLP